MNRKNAQTVESRLDALDATRELSAAEARVVLAKALGWKTAILVARAARITAERGLEDLLPDVEAALDRFLSLPITRDRACQAKTALVDACDDLGSYETQLFSRGVRCFHSRDERDCAAGLRARSLMALFRVRCDSAINEAARLLADRSPTARVGASRAIANGAPIAGVPLLRYKAFIGDDEQRVISEVFSSLLVLDPEESVDFVLEFLRSSDEARGDAAALALGESQSEIACRPLVRWAKELPDRRVDVAFVALALLRDPHGLEYLVDELRHGESDRDLLIVDALAIHAHDFELTRLVREVLRERPMVLATFERAVARVQSST